MSKKGKVGTSGREIQHQLYGTRGRPLNAVEAAAAESNAHLAHCGKIYRGEIGTTHTGRWTAPDGLNMQTPPKVEAWTENGADFVKVRAKPVRPNKWAAARRAQGLREDGTK